jgi:hypothetical protein
MDCRMKKLTADALSFLESQGCVAARDVDEVSQAIPEGVPLSEAQIETIASLGGVQYTGHNGYRVSFFPDYVPKKTREFVIKNAFVSGQDLYLGYCDTNPILEMDDIVMSNSGALRVLGGREPAWTLCDSPYIVVEYDAFLAARNWPCRGHLNLQLGIGKAQLADILHDLTPYEPASDLRNAIWYSDDIALVYYGWLHSVTLEAMESTDAIEFYGCSDSEIVSFKERLAHLASE